MYCWITALPLKRGILIEAALEISLEEMYDVLTTPSSFAVNTGRAKVQLPWWRCQQVGGGWVRVPPLPLYSSHTFWRGAPWCWCDSYDWWSFLIIPSLLWMLCLHVLCIGWKFLGVSAPCGRRFPSVVEEWELKFGWPQRGLSILLCSRREQLWFGVLISTLLDTRRTWMWSHCTIVTQSDHLMLIVSTLLRSRHQHIVLLPCPNLASRWCLCPCLCTGILQSSVVPVCILAWDCWSTFHIGGPGRQGPAWSFSLNKPVSPPLICNWMICRMDLHICVRARQPMELPVLSVDHLLW